MKKYLEHLDKQLQLTDLLHLNKYDEAIDFIKKEFIGQESNRLEKLVSLGDSQPVLLAEMLNNLPENRPLYKDSGLWQIRSDDMKTVIFEQNVNDSFEQFISRVTECLDES